MINSPFENDHLKLLDDVMVLKTRKPTTMFPKHDDMRFSARCTLLIRNELLGEFTTYDLTHDMTPK